MHTDTTVRPDARHARWPVVGGLVSAAVVVGGASAGWGLVLGAPADLAGTFLMAAGIFAAAAVLAGLGRAAWWRARAGRTSYEVAGGTLQVVRAGRVVASWAVADLVRAEVGPPWRWWEAAPFHPQGELPTLTVQEQGRPSRTGWPILLRTPQELTAANAALERAVSAL